MIKSFKSSTFVLICFGQLTVSAMAYYQPQEGRFLQRDPLGVDSSELNKNYFVPLRQYNDGVNIYQYVLSNPLNNRDYSGLKICPLSLWNKNDPSPVLRRGWMHEIGNRGGYDLSFGIQNFNIASLQRAMKRNCCNCISSITIYDHGGYNQGHGPELTRGYQWYGNDRLLKGSDLHPLCPYLCENVTLYLEGCYVGRSDRRALDMLFGACKKIKMIRGCYGRTSWNNYGFSSCEVGYRLFIR